MLLKDKVAIVTGGARGIGRAIVRRFVEEGAKVVIADIDDDGGAGLVNEFAAAGSVRYIRTDVGDRGDVDRMVATSIRDFGTIDVLVNDAAVLKAAEFLELDEADFDRVLRVNLKGAFLCSQIVARHMVDRVKAGAKAGAIVNLSSINAVFAIAEPGSLFGLQGRHQPTDKGDGAGACAVRHSGQRDRAGVDRHGNARIDHVERGGAASDPLPHAAWADRGTGGNRGDRGFPRL